MRTGLQKLKSLKALLAILGQLRRSGKKIVFTNGCFDLIHVGHVRYLARARSLGSILVVGLNRDRAVRLLKGPGRPINSEKDRAEVLGALTAVDYVVLFGEKTPLQLIEKICPDFLVKGGDWKPKDIVGSDFVASSGGRVLSLPFEKGYSTTAILNRAG